MSKKMVPIKYTSRDFNSIRDDLVNYAKRYYGDIIQDFTEHSFNSFMFDSVAYVGDILSYYLDYQANESFLNTAIQYSNVIKLGEELGYRFANSTAAAQGVVALYTTLPPKTDGTPDFQYNPILKKGTVFSTQDGNIFTLMEDVKMYIPGKTIIKTSKFDVNGNPQEYAIKNYGKVISGNTIQKKFTIGEFTKFLKLDLETNNVTDIISVIDEEGHEYFEVDYLTQNVVYREMNNNGSDSDSVQSIMRLYAVPRRFSTKRTQDSTYLVFGGGTSNTSKDYKDILTEPSTFILNVENKKYFSDKYFDPNSMITSDKLGIGPANTVITVLYRVNTFNNVNVTTGFLNNVVTPIVQFSSDALVTTTKNDIINNFEVENEEPIVGSIDLPSIEELKIRIRDSFSAQNRAVTLKDYESIAYSMPIKYGAIKRVKTIKDRDSFRRNLNMYILSEDTSGNFIQATDTLKNNLKIWLSSNKMILDTIDILDAKIINLNVDFKVIGNTKFSKSDILFATKQAIIDFFDRKPEIGEPLLMGDIHSVLRKLDEISDVINVNITQKIGPEYSNVFFDIKSNLSDDERYLIIPQNAVYEIKFPEQDINGVIL